MLSRLKIKPRFLEIGHFVFFLGTGLLRARYIVDIEVQQAYFLD